MDEDFITVRDSFWACVAGALVYGLFYLIAIIVLSLLWHAPWEVAGLATAAGGVAYLSFVYQMGFARSRVLTIALVVLSVLLAIMAGLALLLFMSLAIG